MRMPGRIARICDFKGCSCNEGQMSNRRKDKRMVKRRERQAWKRDLRG